MHGFLSTSTLREFFIGWTELLLLVDRLKAGSAGGKLLQYPKIPPSVSESLAARVLLRERVFGDATYRRGSGADIVVQHEGRHSLVEVKGSGASEFQTFGAKDYAADALLWLRFGEARLLGSESVVQATLFPRPIDSIGPLGSRVTYSRALLEAETRDAAIRHFATPLAELLS